MSHDGHHSVVIPAPGPEFQSHTVAHHFDTPVQEFQSAKLGFWLFLATEILLFGGLFAAYFYYHQMYHETFHLGGQQLDWWLGALNTSVLLLSSWTMAMGVRSAQTSQKGKLLMYCGLTVLGAVIFLVIKFFEYKAKNEHGLIEFAHLFDGYNGATGQLSWFTDHDGVMAGVPHGHLFFAIYLTMTAIHGLHVIIGAGLIVWIMKGAAKGRFHAGYYLPVDLVGLYWHLVDLIWIFLFPLLYLVS
ncbi:MAG: cytochrome c oxidase subunit 3 family protein [Planctomycetes bacterium]|nr:cytochrome c oxidase subunit 3 family protein [Planctomycetota bacterium]MCB9884424.1 cytochrome c oxidase subunit 3 family protein [Planctomycetota bacterium]